MQPTPVFLPGEAQRRGTWQTTAHRVTKSQTRLSDLAHILSTDMNPFVEG